MKRVSALFALGILAPTAAFAGSDGDHCASRFFGGEWLTAISIPIDGVETDIACRFALDRQGKIVTSTCIKETVTATSSTVAGGFTPAQNCRFKGTLSGDGFDLTIDGEINKSRDVMAGLVYGADGNFKPIILLRSAEYRGAKPPKPERPGKEAKDGKSEKGG